MESAWPRGRWSEAEWSLHGRGRAGSKPYEAEGSWLAGDGGRMRSKGASRGELGSWRPYEAEGEQAEAEGELACWRRRPYEAEGSLGAGGRMRPSGSHPPEERGRGPYRAEAELGSDLRWPRGSSGAVESLQELWSAAEGSLCWGLVVRGERTETLRGGRELGEGGVRLGEGVKPPCVVVTEGVGGDQDDVQNRLRRLGAGHLKLGDGAVRSWGSGAR